MELFSISYALLAVQSALLGVVTPELRAVVVDVVPADRILYVRFYYHGECPPELMDLWECALTEASADLGPECILDGAVERCDLSQEIPFRGRFAYLRKE